MAASYGEGSAKNEIVTRCELAQFLKGTSLPPAKRARVLDPDVEANFSSADYILGKFVNDPTSTAIFKNLDTLDQAARQIAEAFLMFAMAVGYGITFVAGLPRSDGYEPWLVKNGFNPVAARGFSHVVTRSARRQAKDLQWLGRVVPAIRVLAKPRQNVDSTRSAIELLLEAAMSTTVFETLFEAHLVRELEFVRLLESAIDSGPSRRLIEIAMSLVKTPALRRGPKTKASSIAHEHILREELAVNRSTAYTYNEIEGDFTDTLTKATRREFDEPDFKPRAARNRIRRNDQIG
jgi:hypothetical protein